MVIEPQGHKARFMDAQKTGDHEAAAAAVKAFVADIVNNIVECPKCAQRNRVPMNNVDEIERAVNHARCGACKASLLGFLKHCNCPRCRR